MKQYRRHHTTLTSQFKSLLITLALLLTILSPLAACAQATTTEPPQTAPVSIESLGEEAYGYVSQLSNLSPRNTGSPSQAQSIAWIKEQYEKMGLAAKVQSFPTTMFSQEKPIVTITSPAERVLEAMPLVSSVSGEVSGAVADIGLGREGDMPQTGLKGQIALIQRGETSFSQKVENAAEAGATAAIIYNNVPGLFRGGLTTPTSIPAVSISQQEGLMLRNLLSQGEVKTSVLVKWEEYTVQNLLTEITGRDHRVIVIGAHYDAVRGSPGANDNASGVAVLLALLRQLAAQPPGYTIRVIAFGAEEEGLVGSSHYVRSLSEEERTRILAMINLDVVGAAVPIAAEGDASLVNEARAVASKLNIEIGSVVSNAASDHLSFLEAKIPAIMITTPDYSRIHSPQDTPATLNSRRLGEVALLALSLVNQLARK